MFDDLSSPMRAKYPDRDVCGKCLMTFVRALMPPNKVDEVMLCPACKRKFWCRGSNSATCWTLRPATG